MIPENQIVSKVLVKAALGRVEPHSFWVGPLEIDLDMVGWVHNMIRGFLPGLVQKRHLLQRLIFKRIVP